MTTTLLDPTDPIEAHIAERLDTELILWFGTVSARGRPHTVPVWFGWEDPTITVFSRPDTAKIGHLRINPAVSLSLDSAASGGDIVIGEGRAELVAPDDAPSLAAFGQKYDAMLGGQSPDEWRSTFSQAIRIRVEKLIAWSFGPDGLDHRTFRA